ncbi:ATP-dependent DNA helicase [Rheinheimera salexigens]|uniref:ATP-dependent DNA helicase YoaA n=1 Tax=Rheinheimera salexigens TaxID=1628148 RepID=A0A1E7Q5C6_9GAMM|nr:ATP-dependent DNA helicase [Rheinheimera salexigens]OEY69356.1 ATP-dependent helicase [Rheinheimera salexigens]
MHNQVSAAFSATGALAKHIDGFNARDAQLDMAKAVTDIIEQSGALVVEAGTGTGKTYAYLVPALLSGKKVVLSTGTKNLQEQLYYRDLPTVVKALASPLQLALLKGRSNYLCLFRLEQHYNHVPMQDDKLIQDLSLIKKWSAETHTGDIGELGYIAEDSKALPYVTSTTDNCLGKECPVYEDCHLLKARKKAQASDLVVVNHHLFFADLALKDTGFGELLPDMDVVIFDEAHQLPDIASDYFGEHVSSRLLLDLCRDIDLACKTELRDHPQLAKVAEKLALLVKDWRLQFSGDSTKGNWREAYQQLPMQTALNRVSESIDMLYLVLKSSLGRSEQIDNVFERLVQIKLRLAKLVDMQQEGVSLWYETTRLHVSLHLTPLSIADKFSAIVAADERSWVFTSATLSVNNGFSHYTEQMGLQQAKTLLLESPFNYAEQALLCVPRFMPEPHQPLMAKTLIDIACQLIEANNGRCFFLFTSHRMLQMVAKQLPDLIRQPVLVQGSSGKRLLLDQFVKLENAVLLGTSSFWEGVDVRGDTLSCVIIDKLPFASPDEPLLQARSENCVRRGQDPFFEVQLPQAVITLKQGVGRLIRDVTDRGVMVICDNRLVTKPYGEIFLTSLPPMRRTRSLDDAVTFLKQIKQETDT